jgi:predicted ATPase
MDLAKLSIENFKCFKNQTDIDFARLTLLTGANSSGKSSIIYSILGPLQSGEFPFQFSTNGKYVNMGDFKEIVHNHNKKSKIRINFKFKNSTVSSIETVWGENLNNNLPQLLELKANSEYFSLHISKISDKFSVSFSYNAEKDPQYEILSSEGFKNFISNLNISTTEEKKKHKTKTKTNISDHFNEFLSSHDIKGLMIDDIPLFNKKSVKKGALRLEQIFSTISRELSEFDEKINFISSFRLHPERTYLEQTKSKIKVNNFGDGYLDQIIIWETKDKSKFNKLITELQKLELLETIKSKRLEGGRYEISVKIKKNGIDTSLSDVGFGISQFLPIIVADFQLAENSTLFIAQPEIHLHPSVQSKFGDYLTNMIKTTKKNYVIETHSEYLLNRIRLAIVKGELKPEDVNIVYVDNELNSNSINKILFTPKGQIINAPANFFKTYMIDVMEIAINAAE